MRTRPETGRVFLFQVVIVVLPETLSRFRFGLEVEAVAGPPGCPLGERGSDHGGRVIEYRLGPVTLADWAVRRSDLRVFFMSLETNPGGDPPTGLHVHVEVPPWLRDALLQKQFFARLARLWEKCEGALLRHRHTGRTQYARAWDEKFKGALARGIEGGRFHFDRYRTLNFLAFDEHGTVEFRLWDSVPLLEKVEEEVSLCLAVVAVAAAGCGQRSGEVNHDLAAVLKIGRNVLDALRRPAVRRGVRL